MRTSLWHLNNKGFPGRLLIVSGLSIIAFGLGPLALPTQSVKRQDRRCSYFSVGPYSDSVSAKSELATMMEASRGLSLRYGPVRPEPRQPGQYTQNITRMTIAHTGQRTPLSSFMLHLIPHPSLRTLDLSPILGKNHAIVST